MVGEGDIQTAIASSEAKEKESETQIERKDPNLFLMFSEAHPEYVPGPEFSGFPRPFGMDGLPSESLSRR